MVGGDVWTRWAVSEDAFWAVPALMRLKLVRSCYSYGRHFRCGSLSDSFISVLKWVMRSFQFRVCNAVILQFRSSLLLTSNMRVHKPIHIHTGHSDTVFSLYSLPYINRTIRPSREITDAVTLEPLSEQSRHSFMEQSFPGGSYCRSSVCFDVWALIGVPLE